MKKTWNVKCYIIFLGNFATVHVLRTEYLISGSNVISFTKTLIYLHQNKLFYYLSKLLHDIN